MFFKNINLSFIYDTRFLFKISRAFNVFLIMKMSDVHKSIYMSHIYPNPTWTIVSSWSNLFHLCLPIPHFFSRGLGFPPSKSCITNYFTHKYLSVHHQLIKTFVCNITEIPLSYIAILNSNSLMSFTASCGRWAPKNGDATPASSMTGKE